MGNEKKMEVTSTPELIRILNRGTVDLCNEGDEDISKALVPISKEVAVVPKPQVPITTCILLTDNTKKKIPQPIPPFCHNLYQVIDNVIVSFDFSSFDKSIHSASKLFRVSQLHDVKAPF